MKTIKIGIIGAGRIGRVHAENIAKFVPEMEIKTIADPYMSQETVEFLRRLRVPNIVQDADVILNDPEIKAVVVCSPTDLHAEYAIKVARAGKDVFVEKPVDYRIERVREVITEAKKAGVKLQVGFNRRFDHNHRAVYEAVRAGKVGKVNLVKISSRDPEPPTIDYVKVSGGIFYDMMVHDFDMARFLAGSEVTEVFAYGGVLVDPAIGEAGDVDTAVVSLKFANGAMGVIDNSRKAVYGYDQRVEVFGSEGRSWMKTTPLTTLPSTARTEPSPGPATRSCGIAIPWPSPPSRRLSPRRFWAIRRLRSPERTAWLPSSSPPPPRSP